MSPKEKKEGGGGPGEREHTDFSSILFLTEPGGKGSGGKEKVECGG